MKHTYSLATLGIILLAAQSLAAQDLTNSGAVISVGSGATLYVPGGLTNTSGGTITNAGTVQIGGTASNAGSLDLSSGNLVVKGDLTNTGTIIPGTGTVTLDGATNQTVAPGGATLATVVVNKTTANNNRVDVSGDLTISNQLTLTNGMVRTTPTAVITLPHGATISSEAQDRYVQGNLRAVRNGVSGTSTVTFPNGAAINPGGNNMGTVTITRTAGLQTANVSYATNPNNSASQGIDRIWNVAATGTAPSSVTPATVTLIWVSNDDNGANNFSQAQMWRRPDVPTGWLPIGPVQNGNARSMSADADGLGQFTVSLRSNPLPVELVRFTAERRGADAWLRWTTAQELNNDRFEVEVSTNGRDFRRIGTVAGRGNTSQRHDYEHTDAQIARYGVETLFYRLRQVDRNGDAHLTDVRTVRVEQAAGFAAAALPNPFGQDGLSVQVRTGQAGPLSLSLHDAVGRVLINTEAEASAGGANVRLPEAAKLPVGVYFLTVRQGAQHTTIKVVRE